MFPIRHAMAVVALVAVDRSCPIVPTAPKIEHKLIANMMTLTMVVIERATKVHFAFELKSSDSVLKKELFENVEVKLEVSQDMPPLYKNYIKKKLRGLYKK